MAELAGSCAASSRRRIINIAAGLGLALYGMAAILLFFWPDGERVRLLMLDLWYAAKGWGLPVWISPEAFSAGANVAAFVPGVFALTVLLRRVTWWFWGLAAVGISAGIELMQMYFFASRVPEETDVLANGLGGVLGAGLGRWFLHRADRKDRDLS